jgi:hypothetical protein
VRIGIQRQRVSNVAYEVSIMLMERGHPIARLGCHAERSPFSALPTQRFLEFIPFHREGFHDFGIAFDGDDHGLFVHAVTAAGGGG